MTDYRTLTMPELIMDLRLANRIERIVRDGRRVDAFEVFSLVNTSREQFVQIIDRLVRIGFVRRDFGFLVWIGA